MGSEHTRDSDWSSLICGFFYFIFVCLYHHLKCVKRLVKIYILHPGFDHTSASTVVCNAQYCVQTVDSQSYASPSSTLL